MRGSASVSQCYQLKNCSVTNLNDECAVIGRDEEYFAENETNVFENPGFRVTSQLQCTVQTKREMTQAVTLPLRFWLLPSSDLHRNT
jgi:hypothetical protein